MERDSRRMKLLEHPAFQEGWAVIAEEVQKRIDEAVKALSGDVESHARLAKNSGRLDAYRFVHGLPERIRLAGQAAAQRLSRKNQGDDSEEELA